MYRYAALLLVGLLAAAALAAAPAPFPRARTPDPSKEDLRKIQGRWYCAFATVLIAGDQMTITRGNMHLDRFFIALDARESPKAISRTRPGFSRTLLGGVTSGVTFRGVYRLEGDTLTICDRLSREETDRQTDFDPSKEGALFWVLKRKQ
jgi:uncharacterized protein (TIGR03067 family)